MSSLIQARFPLVVYYLLAKVFIRYSKLHVENMLGGNSEVETFLLLLKTGRIDVPEPQFLTLISQLNDMVQNREKL